MSLKGICKAIIDKTAEAVLHMQDLKAELSKKGFTVAENEKLPELVEKVRQIANYERIIEGTIMLVSPANSLTLTNFVREPTEVAIYNPTIEDAYISSTAYSKAVVSFQGTFPDDSDTMTVDGITAVKIYDETSGVWAITLSTDDESTAFFSGHAYNYLVVVSKHEEEVI